MDEMMGNKVTDAIAHGNLDSMKFLIEHKADFTPHINDMIIISSSRGHLDIIKFLVENKGDVTTENNRPILYASEQEKIDVVKFLLSKGADYSKVNPKMKIKLLQDKYYRKWRKIVLKRFICKVITPLYYSPGFLGGEKEKKEISLI